MKRVAAHVGALAGFGTTLFSVLACSGAVFSRSDPPADGEMAAGGTAGASSDPSARRAGDDAGSDAKPAGVGGAAGSRATLPPRDADRAEGGASSGGAAGSASPPESGGAGMTEGGSGGAENDGGVITRPDCAAPIHDTWDAQLGTAQSSWSLQFGDPFVDTINQRLVISYDDIAKRDTPLQGGYYAAADITFEGHTVLTPYPHVSDKWLPSLRLDAAGSRIELGSTKYGLENTWQTGPGDFAGASIPATTVRVTLYVQATRQALAVKVQAGSAFYRSGWITDFAEQTDLSVLQYVGENNSSLYGGSGDYVYVGTVDGCEKLSDAAVEHFYAASY